MPPVPVHELQTIEKARAMYAGGARVREICAALGLSVGTLYYHLDGNSLPGAAIKRVPRRRKVLGNALALPSSRGRQKLVARLWRAAERQAEKIEFRLIHEHQTPEGRAADLAAFRELARILRDISAVEDSTRRAAERGVEHEQALAVEGRAVYVSRTRRG
jgi:AcrR family transcriptional regulator